MQPSAHHFNLSRVEIHMTNDIEHAPHWHYIFQEVSSLHKADIFCFSPNCSVSLLRHNSACQIFLVGAGRVRNATEIAQQPEEGMSFFHRNIICTALILCILACYFPVGDTLLSRILGILENPSFAFIEEVSTGLIKPCAGCGIHYSTVIQKA